jgi:hypothetical protein
MSASTLPIPELPRRGAAVPTTYNTPSQRIGAIAWRWNRQFPGHIPYRAKYDMAASDREIDLGFELGQLMSEEYARLRCWYGDPAYGSWPESAKSEQPVKKLVLALMRGEAEPLSERPILHKLAAVGISEEEAA